MVFTHRHAASPSVDARPPRPWGGRSSRQSPWLTFLALALPADLKALRSTLLGKTLLQT